MSDIETILQISRLGMRIRAANILYYSTGESPWSDAEYDAMLAELKQLDPAHVLLSNVGAREIVYDGAEVTLPITMGSLDKIRPADAAQWVSGIPNKFYSRPFAVTPKFDGLSLLLEYDQNGNFKRAYTRGDGVTGRDVSGLIKLNNSIPKSFYAFNRKLFVRGEFILSKSVFAWLQTWAKSQKIKYRNPRNTLVGALNTKTLTPVHQQIIKDASFYAYSLTFDTTEDVLPKLPYVDPSATVRADHAPKTVQLDFLKRVGFKTPPVLTADPNKLDDWQAAMKLRIRDWSKLLEYDIDGLVLEVDSERATSLGYEANGLNPKWQRAVKLDPSEQDQVTVEVSRVTWSRTPRGLFKPIVQLKYPAHFNGVRVKNIYVDNAGFVVKNRLGSGAVVSVIRSGDVIPRIVSIDAKKVFKPKVPKICKKHGEKLVWTPNKVDLYCPICAGVMNTPAQFFKQLGAEDIGVKLIDAACDYLKCNSVVDLLQNTYKLIDAPRFQQKRVEQFKQALTSALSRASLAKIMHASGAFRSVTLGLGETRLRAIIEVLGYNNIFKYPVPIRDFSSAAQNADGIGKLAADCFAAQLESFQIFYDSIRPYTEYANKEINGGIVEGKLKGKKFVFTGFRDKQLENLITNNGGVVTNTINADTVALFVGEKSGKTKIEKAKKFNKIKVIQKLKSQKYIEYLLHK